MISLAQTAFYQILTMFCLIIVGLFCYKVKLIDKEFNKKLSDLVLMLVNPIVIFVSYQRKFNASLLKGLLIALVLAIITQVLAIVTAHLFLHKRRQEANSAIEHFAMVYSNCGFIGIPLVNGIVGSTGVFYLTAYMTIFNLSVWTHGLILITGKSDRKSIGKAMLSPSIIATVSGFLLFIARLQLPDVMVAPLRLLGDMNTPLAMLVSGATIAQTNILQLFCKFRAYSITFMKLVFIPAVMVILFSFLPISKDVYLTSILATACPTAATINLFAVRYDNNSVYASELFAMTTLFSMVTIPVIMTFASLFIS
jgi:predicted permease